MKSVCKVTCFAKLLCEVALEVPSNGDISDYKLSKVPKLAVPVKTFH